MATDQQVIDALQAKSNRYQDAGGKWLPAAQIAALLCTGEEMDNPTPQADVPLPIDVDAAIGLLEPATCGKLAALPPIVDFVEKANAGNQAGALRWISLAAKGGILTPGDVAALQELASKTAKDPTWQAKVTGPPPLDSVSVEQVAKVLGGLQ